MKGCEGGEAAGAHPPGQRGRAELDPKIQNTVMQEYARLRRSERSLIFFINNVAHLDAGGARAGQAAAPGQEGGGDRQAPLRGGGDH